MVLPHDDPSPSGDAVDNKAGDNLSSVLARQVLSLQGLTLCTRKADVSPDEDKDGSQNSTKDIDPEEKWRILKNVGVISFAFMVQFTAFQGTANLQSSINAENGLGTSSLSVIYASLLISCIFVPTFVIKRLTVKWTLCISLLCYAPYIGSQMFPAFYTLMPTAVIVGLGAAPMWAAKGTYLTQAAAVYAKITDQCVDAIIVRFFGFFFLAWQTAELWGNLISSLVMSSESASLANETEVTNEELSLCGSSFCPAGNLDDNENLERPPDHEIYTIIIIYLCCILAAAAIIGVFLDPLTRYGEKQRRKEMSALGGFKLLAATLYQLQDKNQLLLIPLTIWIGMEQAFIGADFTQAYVSCAWGIPHVGFVMVCMGIINGLCSVVFGSVVKYIGRNPVIMLGAVLHSTLLAALLMWRPSPDSPFIFFTMSGLWGVADAVWQTQVNGLYGILFSKNKEAAFSNFRLWESTGFVVAYAYSTFLCTTMKLYVMMGVLCCGVVGYVFVEIVHSREKKKTKKEKEVEAQKHNEEGFCTKF